MATIEPTPTPRTDARAVYRDGSWECVDADCSRELERELEHVRALLIESNSKNYPRAEEIQLIYQLSTERAAREQAEARLATMRGTVGFFASVIKCRERWSEQCDEAMECMKDTPPPILAEVQRLRAAITEHHKQKADDRCIEDDDKLYAAAGLPPCDRRVGDKAEMLKKLGCHYEP